MNEIETVNEQEAKETVPKKRITVKDLVTLGLLTGVLLLMSFTPLGYFHTIGLDVSLMMIPVAIGAMLLGPNAGAWLGLVFGGTSFYQALTGASAFSTMLLNINPFYAFLLCVPTRVLMGFLTGLIFKVVQFFDWRKTICYFIGGFFAAFLNTVFFMSVFILCYWNTEFVQGINETLGSSSPLPFVVAFVGVNGALEMSASCLVGGIVAKAVSRALYKKTV